NPGGGQLRYGQRAGPADHEVGPRVRLSHVLNERTHVCADARGCVTLTARFDPTLAGLVAYVNGRKFRELLQTGERKWGPRIHAGRALAAADHENSDRAAAIRESDR